MPKRSLNPRSDDAKKIEQLNRAVDALLARADGKPPEGGRKPSNRWCAWRPTCATCRAKNSRHDLNPNYWKGERL